MSGWPEPRYYCTTHLSFPSSLLPPPSTSHHQPSQTSLILSIISVLLRKMAAWRLREAVEELKTVVAAMPQTLDQCIDWRPLWAALRPSHTQYGQPAAWCSASQWATDWHPNINILHLTPPPTTTAITETRTHGEFLRIVRLTTLGMVPVYKKRKY